MCAPCVLRAPLQKRTRRTLRAHSAYIRALPPDARPPHRRNRLRCFSWDTRGYKLMPTYLPRLHKNDNNNGANGRAGMEEARRLGTEKGSTRFELAFPIPKASAVLRSHSIGLLRDRPSFCAEYRHLPSDFVSSPFS